MPTSLNFQTAFFVIFLPLKTIKHIKGTMARWWKKQFVVHPPKGCRMYKPQALYCGVFLNQPNFVCVDFCMHQVRTLPGRCWERESQCLTQWFEFWVSCSVDCFKNYHKLKGNSKGNWKLLKMMVLQIAAWILRWFVCHFFKGATDETRYNISLVCNLYNHKFTLPSFKCGKTVVLNDTF